MLLSKHYIIDKTPYIPCLACRTASGLTLTDVATLYGAVDKQQVNLSAHKANGNNSILVSFPDPHLVLPGRPHGSNIRAAKAGYKAKVSNAFGIRI